MHFFTDAVEVAFTFLQGKTFTVSSTFCEFTLPFISSPVSIKWYGVIIAFGFTLAVLFGGRTAYKWKIDIYKMLDVLIYGAFFGIIGARAYYVISEWSYYGKHLSEVFMIWHGGLAIYGGLIGGLIGAFFVCKKEKINILNLLDLCGMSFLIGQGIGRWGNYANQEAFGINTSLPWGMYSAKTESYLTALVNSGTDLVVDPSKPVHPTFLYESLWCLLGFVILYIIMKKFRKFSGQLFLIYGVWYGVERAVVEGLRTDSLYIANTGLRVSQVLSIVLASVSFVLLVILLIKYIRHPKPIEGVDYFSEIPVYNKKRKALDAKALYEKLDKAAAELESTTAGSSKAVAARKKAETARAKYEEAQKLSDEADVIKAEKKAKKEAEKSAKAAKKL